MQKPTPTCVNISKLRTLFLKPQVIFYDTTPLYIFSSNITYFLQK